MSRAHGDAATASATPHQLVRELETSIAARLTEADRAGDEVARARTQATRLLAEAEVEAVEEARRRTVAILSAAGAEAARLTADGVRRAEDLTATAARRRDDDVRAVLRAVLPERVRSPREEAS